MPEVKTSLSPQSEHLPLLRTTILVGQMIGSNIPFSCSGTGTYRFGFNGKEHDNEIHGTTGTSYDFGARLHDPRVGRWLSLDPLAQDYAHLSPFNFAANNSVLFVDPDGKKIFIYYYDAEGNNQAYEYGTQLAMPDNEFVRQTVAALDVLGATETAGKDISFLTNTEEYNINIERGLVTEAHVRTAGGGGYFFGSTDQQVEFNPTLGLRGSDGKVLPAYGGLWHELGHVLGMIENPKKYMDRMETKYTDPEDPNHKWNDADEKYVIENYEHKLADEKGLLKRQGHKRDGIEIIEMESSTSTKPK